ncbi:alpha/beta fold hydrolase [Steroidobacter flavus]|uniref:Alpha/beta fold hydrolase n=1 Tax=Steroidobacter flavus TaxID=1842136 RepID=A0ABV8T5W8_9GAMM
MPGFDGTGEMFGPLTTALSTQYPTTVIRYRDERTFDDYVDTVSAALPDQGGATLVAESFSGPVALAVMARHPTKIQRAVLCATFVESPFRSLTKLARFVPPAAFGLKIGQRAMLQRFCLDDGCDPALMDQALAVVRSMPAVTVAARINVLAALQVRTLCPNIRTSILILRATGDRLVSPSRYNQLIEALPGATVKAVEGPHLLLQSRPKECARLIEEFTGMAATMRG